MNELVRDCGRLSGALLDNISTEESARDLNYLRQLVGDKTGTYVGLSCGSFLGETYANMFPDRVRAMLLDSIANPTDWASSAEARSASQTSSTDEVFAQFLAPCQRAGPARCAPAGHNETVTQRVAQLFQQARRARIPAPQASPPGVLSCGDLLLTNRLGARIARHRPVPKKHNNARRDGFQRTIVVIV